MTSPILTKCVFTGQLYAPSSLACGYTFTKVLLQVLNFAPLASDEFLRLVRSKIEPVEISCLTESQKFLAKKWNLKLPFLPVTTKGEAN